MSNLSKHTFLRFLKGAPLSILIGLWVHGAMDRKSLVRRTGWGKTSVDEALVLLEECELINRPHYRKWALSDGFHQLPFANLGLPESPLRGTSAKTIDMPEVPSGGTSANYVNPEVPSGGTSGPTLSDQIRSEDEEEEIVDNVLPPFFDTSMWLLETIGIGGKDVPKMAQYKPHEVLGAWWYLNSSDWAKNPRAVLCTHLLRGQRTPYGFLELAQWYFDHGEEHELLTEALYSGTVEISLSHRGRESAAKVLKQLGELSLERSEIYA